MDETNARRRSGLLPVRVGMGQMLVAAGQPEANLERAATMARRARADDCDMLVLPECLDVGWTSGTTASLATPVPGPVSDELARIAREHGLVLAAGMTERADASVYNTALLFGPDGRLLLRHRKINEVAFARRIYDQGTTLGVTDTPVGVVGLNICADNLPEAQELGLALATMGADILLSPCSWAVRPEFDNTVTPYGADWVSSYRRIAGRTGTALIGVSNVGLIDGGDWDGWRCIGASLAVGPDGAVLARGSFGERAEELVVVEVSRA
ncbi:nitrilase family protein [Georgenia halophila]|uniref:Nitrilase family protein n=1 Tax=Georgenia halophila TaxID=620889 RepID=A0ABP8LAX3_9MICO